MRNLYRILGDEESRIEALRNVDFDKILKKFKKLFKKADLITLDVEQMIQRFLYDNTNFILTDDAGIDNDDRFIKICTAVYLKSAVTNELRSFIRTSDTFRMCDDCGRIFRINDETIVEVDSQHICSSCYSANFTTCDDCGRAMRNGRGHIVYDLDGGEDSTICSTCADDSDNYLLCNSCGRLYHRDDMTYCDGCEEYYCNNHQCDCGRIKVIHSYSYKPSPIFHGKGKRHMGIELEIDNLNDRYEFAAELKKSVPPDLIYFKTDGSLSDCGVEIVTHPCTLEYIKSDFPFDKIHDLAREYNGTSHSAGNCGLHVHVSNRYFSNYELGATKILYFFEKFWTQLAKLSRRNDFHYCKRNDKPELNTEYVHNVKWEATKSGRYTAVNLCNAKTIEFRLWRGTLNVSTIIATLELTDLICIVCENTSIMTLQKMTWDNFKKEMVNHKYKALIKYCQQLNV